jgi:hypothetical protein
LSTSQSTLPGKDNWSAATACSSDSVPIMPAAYHQRQFAIISHNQVVCGTRLATLRRWVPMKYRL